MDNRPSNQAAQPVNALDAAIGMRLAYWAYEHKDIQKAEKVATYPDAWEHAKPGIHLPAGWAVARQDAEGRLLPGSPEGWNTQHNADGQLENQFKVSINRDTHEISFDFKGSDAWSNWKSDLGNAGASEFAKIEAKAQAAYEYLPQSVSEFPSGSELTGLMEEAGLCQTSFHPLTGGIATVYLGEKPR